MEIIEIKAHTSCKKKVSFTNTSIEYIVLPSNIPANIIRINEKIKLWKKNISKIIAL
jgi:hypothetical protein